MNIVQKYYIREYLKLLSLICIGVALIFSLLDLVDKIDDFIPGKLTIASIAQYVVLSIPKFILYLLPMSVLLCSLFVFGMATRNRELIAIKASGGKLKRLFRPFIVSGFLLSLLAFILGEFTAPEFSERLIQFKSEHMGKAEKVTAVEGSVWLRGTDGSIIRLAFFNPGEKVAKGISILLPGEEKLRKRIEAREAKWFEGESGTGTWILTEVIVYNFEEGSIYRMPSAEYPYLESPAFFARGIRKPEEMGISELSRYMARLQAAGIKDSKLSVDFQVKVSYPLMNFFMMILGLSLSGMSRTGGGLFAVGMGISLSFVYWLLFTFTLSLGYARVIHPSLSPWIVPTLFGIISWILFKRIRE